MNQNFKSKVIKETRIDEKHIYNAKKLTKVYDKDTKKYIFKSTDVIIKKSFDSIKIYFYKKNKEILISHLCLKHIFVNRATDSTVPRIDSCRVFSDPVIKHTLLSFPNPGIANDYELKISKDREIYNAVYANISFYVNVTNKINETIKESASVCVSGLTTGAELKTWIEKEFNFPEVHMPKYLLQLQVENNIQTIRDDIPLLMLYEHMSNYGTHNLCSRGCYVSSKAPLSTLWMHINLNVSEYKYREICHIDSYSIEQRWGAGMMPNWLMRLLADLYHHGPQYEGVFRLSGKDSSLAKWYRHMLEYDDFLITEDIYNKAAILKYFMRNIEGSLMTQSNKKEFNSLCKKFMKISAEKYLESDKKTNKLIRMIQALPKTHLFLLQNILVVIQALTESEKTLFKPFSIARAISPSIFPLMHLSRWKYGTKLFEAIILLTDRLVSDSTRQIIIDNFAKFYQNTDLPSVPGFDSEIDLMSDKYGSTSMLSQEECDHKNIEVDSKDLYESNSESESSGDENFVDAKAVSKENGSSSQSEDQIPSESDLLAIPLEESVKEIPFPISSLTTLERETTNSFVISDLDRSSGSISSEDNLKMSKNICMGVKMKELYRSCGKSIDLDLSTDADSSKENNQSTLNNEKIGVGLRHRSLLKLDNSCRELNRSSSAIVSSPRVPRLRNRDYCDPTGSPDNRIMRKNSRKALSAVVELNNNSDTVHRSRSPNVKSLIKMYEERNRVTSSDDLGSTEAGQKSSRFKNEFGDPNIK